MLRRLGASAAALLALALVGCAGPRSPSVAAPTPSASAEVRSIVVIGDSIPYNSSDYCPGCTSFPDSMATALSDAEGVRYEAINRSRYDGAQTADILEQVESGELDEELSKAAIIVVSSGFNDQPPYWEAGEPCSSGAVDTDDDAIDGVLATTSECITEQTATVGNEFSGVLKQIRTLAPNATLITLTSYNSWSGWAPLQRRAPEEVAAVEATVIEALQAWRDTMCAETEAAGGSCVDLLEAFNGSDGTEPAGDLLAGDYTHPSQAGNDLISERVVAAVAG